MSHSCRFVVLRVLFVCLAFYSVSAPALGAPSGRQYELVSPVYKGGFGALFVEAVSEDGNSLAFYSPGAFANTPAGLQSFGVAPYLARRGDLGWSTVPIMPPDSLLPYAPTGDVSRTLDLKLATGKPGPNVEDAIDEGVQWIFMRHETALPDTTPNWTANEPVETLTKGSIALKYAGATEDFCHVIVNDRIDSDPLVSKGVGAHEALYEFNLCDSGPFEPHLVGVDNKGNVLSPACAGNLGTQGDAFNAIADNGNEIFFVACVHNEESHRQLFVRLGGTHTLEVSKPLSEKCSEVPCKEAERPSSDFVGASEDGSRVFFTTAATLTKEGDSTSNLYMAKIGCREAEPECSPSERVVTSLVRVSQPAVAVEPADVQGVVRVAPDGSRIYFTAAGELLSEAEVQTLEDEGRSTPHRGADNLYVYDEATGRTTFVGDLCTGDGLSGTHETPQCPNSGAGPFDATLANGGFARAQTAGRDGRFLVFTTYARLVNDDTDDAQDVYRYDAASNALQRVSLGEAGHDVNGNDSSFDASIALEHKGGSVRFQYEMDNRAISEDGSRIVFTTAEPLSTSAINGLANVYEWHEGKVALLSGGISETPVEDVVIDPMGENIFFVTTQGLVGEDIDGTPDVYDARIDGGFPAAPAPRQPCSGDACQGPLTQPAPLLVPGSISQAPGGNYAATKATVTKTKKKHAKTKRKRRKRAKAHHGKAHGSTGTASSRRRK